MSLDGCIALADGTSQWITGEAARAHGTCDARAIRRDPGRRRHMRADRPRLDVRLPGLEARNPEALGADAGRGAGRLAGLAFARAVQAMAPAQYCLIEGGADAAAAFLKADLVDRLLLYRGPVVIGARGCARWATSIWRTSPWPTAAGG